MDYEKGAFLYEGKAKKVYQVQDHEGLLWVECKDDLTAFNAQKKGSFAGKGELNCKIASLIFTYLDKAGIANHWVGNVEPQVMICRRVQVVPLEVVVRNRLAGSTAKKFQKQEGAILENPLVEFFYKSDELGDPFVSDEQALMLEAVTERRELEDLKVRGREVNKQLQHFFSEAGVELIDFKLEFGYDDNGQLVLADEITPDTCRLWELTSEEKLDKDRFRRDLGDVKNAYEQIWKRIQSCWEERL